MIHSKLILQNGLNFKYMKSIINNCLEENIKIAQELIDDQDQIEQIANEVLSCLKRGGKIIFLGNGGSAADATHMAAEFVSKFSKVRRSLPALALTTNLSVITSIANDFSYEDIFSRQLESMASENDLVICFSTSGESKNVIKAIEHCGERGIKTISFTKNGDNTAARLSHISFKVPSSHTARIQETYILINHIICELVDDKITQEINA